MLADISFTRRQLKTKRNLAQQGGQTFHGMHRPLLQNLLEYETVTRYDTQVRYCLRILLNAIIGSLSEIEHPDKEIQSFLRANIQYMLNEHGVDYKQRLKTMIKTSLWAGFSITENLYELYEGNVILQDLITYHPATIQIRTNRQGRLTENEPSWEGFESGVYQNDIYGNSKTGETQLSLWKIAILTNDSDFNNYYGQSAIEGVYRWYLLKEALLAMMTEALDKFGNPLLAITLPSSAATHAEYDEESGEEVTLSDQQLLEQQLNNNISTGEGNVLILPQHNKDMKPEVKVITTGNNHGDMYSGAIDMCDQNIAKGLLVPFGLSNSGPNSDGKALEKHIEVFNKIVSSFVSQFVQPAVNQTFFNVIKYNFARESAKIAPTLPYNNATSRAEDKVALMQMIKGLTQDGYLIPTNASDWEMVREMVSTNFRQQSNEDLEYIKQLIIYPRNPNLAEFNKEDDNSKSIGVVDPSRDRSMEGKVKGKGQRGRPAGISTPQIT